MDGPDLAPLRGNDYGWLRQRPIKNGNDLGKPMRPEAVPLKGSRRCLTFRQGVFCGFCVFCAFCVRPLDKAIICGRLGKTLNPIWAFAVGGGWQYQCR